MDKTFPTRVGGWHIRWVALGSLYLGAGIALHADTIYLKDGRTVVGVIDTSLSDDRKVVISTQSGIHHIPRNRVDRLDIRKDVSPDEVRGDLSANEQDFDRAIELYGKALKSQPENKELEKKIADVKVRIKERDDKRFGLEFQKVDKLIAAREYETALGLAQALADKTEAGSARQSCLNKVAAVHIEQARDYRNVVNYPQAEKSYRLAIEANPEGAVAQLELADLVQRTPTRQKEAMELYQQGIDLAINDPTLMEAKELLKYRSDYAKIHLMAQKYREAARLFWIVVENDPQGQFYQAPDSIIQAYLTIGPELAKESEENAEAIGILEKIMEKRPNEERARYMVGKIYFDRGDYPKAITYLEQALKIMDAGYGSANHADCRYYLGLAYRKTEKDEEAIRMYKSLLEIQPDRYEGICELGEVYYELSKFKEAIEQFQKGVKIEPAQYRAYVGAGRTLRRMGKYQEAVVMYEELIKLRDDNAEYYYELGLTYTELKRHEDAAKIYAQVMKLMEKEDATDLAVKQRLGEVWGYLGATNIALKKYSEAIEQLDKSLANIDNYGAALASKGLAYRELGQLEEAEEFFKKALATDPKKPEYHLNLGVLNHKFKKDTATALKFYTDYYANGGTDPQVAGWIRECGGTPP